MAGKIGRSFFRMAVLLVLVSLGAFLLVSVSPIDPLQTNIGQAALGSMSQEQIICYLFMCEVYPKVLLNNTGGWA